MSNTAISNRNEVDETLRVFEKGYFLRLLAHLKDLCGIVLMYLSVLFPICMEKTERNVSFMVSETGKVTSYIFKDCYEMMRSVTLIGIVLLVFNSVMIYVGFNGKSLKYHLAHYLGNIVLYGLAMTFSSKACNDATASCQGYKTGLIIVCIGFIAIYSVCTVFAVIRERRNKAND